MIPCRGDIDHRMLIKEATYRINLPFTSWLLYDEFWATTDEGADSK